MNTYRFLGFRVHVSESLLARGPITIDLNERSFRVLVHLIENCDRTVSIDEIRRTIWDGDSISSSTIPTCIREIRKALNDDFRAPLVVETNGKRGYRFIARLEEPSSADRFLSPEARESSLCGRERELEELRSAYLRSRDQQGRNLAIVRGEAGMGKTRFVREFLREIDYGTRIFVASCPEFDGAAAFLPLTKIRPELVRSLDEASPKASRDIPVSAAQHPNSRPRPEDRFALFNNWTLLIRDLAAQSPIVIAIEDLHRADPDTIDLLTWLATESATERCLLIVTTRPNAQNENATDAIERLYATNSAPLIDLLPLNEKDVEQMAAELGAIPESLSKQVFERTAGHPLFSHHLLHSIAEHESSTAMEEALAETPQSSRGLAAHQLRQFEASTKDALRLAAVFGSSFPLDVCAVASGRPVGEFLADLAPAIETGLLVADGQDGSFHRFRHTIFRDALYETISITTRKQLHLSFAGALTGRATAAEPTESLIAEHLERSIPLSSPSKAARYRWSAGKAHLRKFAFREAKANLSRARTLFENSERLSAAEECELRFDLAEAQLFSHDRNAARTTLFEAADIAREACETSLLAECAIRIAPSFLSIEVGPYDARHASLLSEALKSVESTNTDLRSRLSSDLSRSLSWSDRSGESAALADAAVDLAKKSSNPTTVLSALAAKSDALHGPRRTQKRAEVNRQLRSAADSSGDPRDIVMHQVREASLLLDSGHIRQFDALTTSLYSLTVEIDTPHFSWFPLAFRATRELMRGELAHAEELSGEFSALAKSTGDMNVATSRACQQCAIALELDSPLEGAKIAAPLVERFPGVQSWIAGAAMLTLRAGDLSSATRILDMFDRDRINSLFDERGGAAGVAFLSEIAVSTGDKRKSSLIYDICAPVGSKSATLGYAIAYFGTYHRYAAMLASELGLHSEALEHASNALDAEKRNGSDLWRIHAQIDMANAITASRGDANSARQLCAEARLSADKLNLLRATRRSSLLTQKLDSLD